MKKIFSGINFLLIAVVFCSSFLYSCGSKEKIALLNVGVDSFYRYEMYEGEQIEIAIYPLFSVDEMFTNTSFKYVEGENLDLVKVEVFENNQKSKITALSDFGEKKVTISKYVFEYKKKELVYEVDIELCKNREYSLLEPSLEIFTFENRYGVRQGSFLQMNPDEFDVDLYLLLNIFTIGNNNMVKDVTINDFSILDSDAISAGKVMLACSKDYLSDYDENTFKDFSKKTLNSGSLSEYASEVWLKVHIKKDIKDYVYCGFAFKLDITYHGENYVITKLVII